MREPLNLRDQHLEHFWGKWLRRKPQQESGTEKQGLAQANEEEEWVDTDFEEHEDEGWGMKRPGKRQDSDSDLYESDWDDDDDDDDQGGHMMPVAH